MVTFPEQHEDSINSLNVSILTAFAGSNTPKSIRSEIIHHLEQKCTNFSSLGSF